MLSNGFTYNIQVNILGENALTTLTSNFAKLDKTLDGVRSDIGKIGGSLKSLSSSGVNNLTSSFAGLAAQIGGIQFGLSSLRETASFEGVEKAIKFSSGGEKTAIDNLKFLNDEIEHFGLGKKDAFDGFRQLSGSMMGTGITANETRNIFDGMTKAATALGMSSADTGLGFLALSQMASKGKVTAEELRGQLGERLPGAFGLFAESLGVSTSKLDDMLKDGLIKANEALPKFAKHLQDVFGGQAESNINSATANFNRFGNAIFDLKIAIGTHLMPTVIPLIKDFLIPSFHWLGENIDMIKGLASVYAGFYTTAKLLDFGKNITSMIAILGSGNVLTLGGALTQAVTFFKGYSLANGLASIANWTFVGSLRAIGAAFMALPFGWVIPLLGAVTGGIVWAWKEFDTFRATVKGTIAYIWEFGKAIIDYIWMPLKSLGNFLYGAFSRDIEMMKSASTDFFLWNINKSGDAGRRAGTAFTDAWNAEMGNNFGLNKKLLQEMSGMGDAFAVKNVLGESPLSKLQERSSLMRNFKPESGGANAPTVPPNAKKGIDEITGGGRQQKNIHITIGKLNEQITVHTVNLKEGAKEIEDQLMRMLMQVMNMANQTQ